VSCGTGEKNLNSGNRVESPKAFLFRMQHFFTESENLMSFPLWFEDSIIASNGISHFSREIFHISLNSGGETEEKELDLREKRDYFFNKAGTLDSMVIQYFFDDLKIGIVSFYYDEKLDKNGFCKMVRRLIRIPGDGGLTSAELPFHLFNQRWSSNKFLSFKDQGSGIKYHYMLNKKYYGPLSVDSIINPGPDDVVFLGSPLRPEKKYSVVNKVHERNVHLYDYFEDSENLKSYTRSEFPFDVKRNILYGKNGFCTGYVDSTFSDRNFLTRTTNNFTLNKNKLPIRLDRLKENQESKSSLVSVEKYEYEFFKD
jgi:hypothetical protein